MREMGAPSPSREMLQQPAQRSYMPSLRGLWAGEAEYIPPHWVVLSAKVRIPSAQDVAEERECMLDLAQGD